MIRVAPCPLSEGGRLGAMPAVLAVVVLIE